MNPQNFTETGVTGVAGVSQGKITVEDRTLSHGEPAEPLMGLPLARWIPMDVHSMMDYANGIATASGALMAEDDDAAAQIASVALGASAVMVSALTDYRLSVAKIIPIRTHEAIDYAWGASAIALPFVLGYWKTSPRTALQHIVAGAGNILASLLTDYRSFRKDRQLRRAPSSMAH